MRAGKRRQKHSSTGGFGAAALGLYLAWQFQITDRNIQEKLLVNNPFFFFSFFSFSLLYGCGTLQPGFPKAVRALSGSCPAEANPAWLREGPRALQLHLAGCSLHLCCASFGCVNAFCIWARFSITLAVVLH